VKWSAAGGIVPSAGAYTRFLHHILDHLDDVEAMMHPIIDDLQQA
jgi:hypothetical protein